jgi:tetratricopeptide (TPR) repeat protein
MGHGFMGNAWKYAGKVGKHLGRVATRKESAGEAWRQIGDESRRLRRDVTDPGYEERHQQAKKHMKRAQMAYNDGLYEDAENHFRGAISADPGYAKAYVYLGHTLYKLRRGHEAIQAWEKAIEVDPKSSAAENARRKLAMVREQDKDVSAWMKETLDKQDV